MTWAERFRAAAEFASAAWRWLVLVGAVVLMLLLARACNAESAAKAEVRRMKAAGELRERGFIVAAEATQAELDARAATIKAMQPELERLRKESKQVRVVRVERIVTAPAPAEGVPRPAPEPGQPCPTCLFAWGDTGQLRIDSVDLETKEGVQVAMVAGEAWRLKPEPATRILAGVGSAKVSTVMAEPLPLENEPGWGAGAFVGASSSGVAVGPALAFPPVRFLGLQFEATLAGGVNPASGSVQASATGIGRW